MDDQSNKNVVSNNETPSEVYPTSPLEPTPSSFGPAPVESKSKKGLLYIVAGVLTVAAIGFGLMTVLNKDKAADKPVATNTKTYRIGLSLDTLKELRWHKDRQYLEAKAKEMGVQLSVLVADGDDDLQVSQMENLISQKVDVIIVVAHSSVAIAPTIDKAHEAGIKVLSYDRLVLNSDADMYISFDNEKVGVNSANYVVEAVAAKPGAKIAFVGGAPTDNNATQIHTGALSVLTPLIASNKVKLVFDKPSTDWKPDEAYKNLKAYLAIKGNTVDGVIAGNDGTAGGAIQALQEVGLAGKVPVAAQDAELPALQRIVAGTQGMTNYKPIKLLADKAMELAVSMAKGEKPQTNAETDNGKKKVPSYLLIPVPVTKDNIRETIIKDGFLTEKEIYKN